MVDYMLCSALQQRFKPVPRLSRKTSNWKKPKLKVKSPKHIVSFKTNYYFGVIRHCAVQNHFVDINTECEIIHYSLITFAYLMDHNMSFRLPDNVPEPAGQSWEWRYKAYSTEACKALPEWLPGQHPLPDRLLRGAWDWGPGALGWVGWVATACEGAALWLEECSVGTARGPATSSPAEDWGSASGSWPGRAGVAADISN